MKFISALYVFLLLVFSFNTSAKEPIRLIKDEKAMAHKLFNRLQVKNTFWSFACHVKKVRIWAKTTGDHKSNQWIVRANRKNYSMTPSEIDFARNLFQRINVPVKKNALLRSSSVEIKSVQCDFVIPQYGEDTTNWTVYIK